MRRGVRIAIDVGTVRIGVARSDPHGILAIVAEHEAIEVLIGLPVALSGRDTASTADARGMAEAVAERSGVPVRLVDERLTTVTAQGQLHASGRTTRGSRGMIDQVAAVIMLEHALETERRTGRPAGVSAGGGAGPDEDVRAQTDEP